jgi:hypothetical protein
MAGTRQGRGRRQGIGAAAGSGAGAGIPPGYVEGGMPNGGIVAQPSLPGFPMRQGDTDWPGIQKAIARLNRSHAVTRIGGKVVVLTEARDAEGQLEISFLPATDFTLLHLPDQYIVDGELAPIGPLWLRSRDRRQYDGVVFAPVNSDDTGGAPPGWYNLWQGFSVAPAARVPKKGPGSIGLFLDHILTNLARGDRSLCDWILGWFAHMIQRPTERFGTALVLRGKMGTGKSKAAEIVGRLIPGHYMMVDNPAHIVGKHNAHMKALLLLQADEGFWAGNKEAEGRLKSLVTSERQLIEPKNVDAIFMRNYVRLFISSNERWVVPAGMEERRWAVVDVGDGVIQNHEYFAAMDAEMADGGLASLLRFLLDFDLSRVNLRQIPKTQALLDQKLVSLGPAESFWFEVLKRGSMLPDDDDWRREISKAHLYKAYVGYAETLGFKHKLTPSNFGKRLHDLVPELRSFRPDGATYDPLNERPGESGPTARPRCYGFPTLAECREMFAEAMGQAITWEGPD